MGKRLFRTLINWSSKPLDAKSNSNGHYGFPDPAGTRVLADFDALARACPGRVRDI